MERTQNGEAFNITYFTSLLIKFGRVREPRPPSHGCSSSSSKQGEEGRGKPQHFKYPPRVMNPYFDTLSNWDPHGRYRDVITCIAALMPTHKTLRSD